MNTLLAAIGYNFSPQLAWITFLWVFIQQLSSEETMRFADFGVLDGRLLKNQLNA